MGELRNTAMIDKSQQTAAKIAGVTGLLAVVIVVFGNYVLLSPLIVPRDSAETARNIMTGLQSPELTFTNPQAKPTRS